MREIFTNKLIDQQFIKWQQNFKKKFMEILLYFITILKFQENFY